MGYDSPTITWGRGNYTRTMTYMEAYGPLTMGNMVGWLMTGMMLCATWNYFTHKPKDRLIIRLIVIVSLVSPTGSPAPSFANTLDVNLHTASTSDILALRLTYQLTVLMCLTTIILKSIGQILMILYHPGDPTWIVNARKRPAIWLGPLFNDLTTCTVQSIMAYRTISFARAMRWSYGRKMAIGFWIMVFVLCAGILVDWIFGVAYPVYAYLALKDYARAVRRNRSDMRIFVKLGSAQSAAFFAVDVLLTIAMTVQMSMAKTGFAGSNAILDSLISITIRNGLAVSVCQMILLILYRATSTYWTIIFHSWIGQLYVLTLISILIQPRRAHEAYLRDTEKQHGEIPHRGKVEINKESIPPFDPDLGPIQGDGDGDGDGGGDRFGVREQYLSLSSNGVRQLGSTPSEIISSSTKTFPPILIPTPRTTSSTLISSVSSIAMISSPSGPGPSGLSGASGIRCRNCGASRETELQSPKSSTSSRGIAGIRGERRDSGLIGFRAALMDLEEASDDSHDQQATIREQNEDEGGGDLDRIGGDIGLGLELGIPSDT